MKRIRETAVILAMSAAATFAFGQTASTTKHTGPGKNTKVKSETVVGTVKTYEAGKKITVTGPKNKDYSFDLDENVSMTGASVNQGDKVKVTYTKGDNGMKAVTIGPATAKKSKKAKKAA